MDDGNIKLPCYYGIRWSVDEYKSRILLDAELIMFKIHYRVIYHSSLDCPVRKLAQDFKAMFCLININYNHVGMKYITEMYCISCFLCFYLFILVTTIRNIMR